MEIGKIYVVRTISDTVWLFRYDGVRGFKTSCSHSVCLHNGTKYHNGYICSDSAIRDLRLANSNYLAMWNRHFPDSMVAINHSFRSSYVNDYQSSMDLITRYEELYSMFI